MIFFLNLSFKNVNLFFKNLNKKKYGDMALLETVVLVKRGRELSDEDIIWV